MTLDALNDLKFLPELSDADVFTCLSLGVEKGGHGTRQAPFQNVGNSYVSTVLPELTYITRAMRAQKKDWVHLNCGYLEHEGRKLFFREINTREITATQLLTGRKVFYFARTDEDSYDEWPSNVIAANMPMLDLKFPFEVSNFHYSKTTTYSGDAGCSFAFNSQHATATIYVYPSEDPNDPFGEARQIQNVVDFILKQNGPSSISHDWGGLQKGNPLHKYSFILANEPGQTGAIFVGRLAKYFVKIRLTFWDISELRADTGRFVELMSAAIINAKPSTLNHK